MHFDLAHALVTALLIFTTFFVLRKIGVIKEGEKGKVNWVAVGAVVLVVFIFNLIWPYGP